MGLIDKKLTLSDLKSNHGKPVFCFIPSDKPAWGIVDVVNECVVLGLNHVLNFEYYGEWYAWRRVCL